MDKEILRTLGNILIIVGMILWMVFVVGLLLPTEKPVPVNQISHFKCEAYKTKLVCTLEKVSDERSNPNETGSTVR